MRTVFICTDMEGLAGVDHWDQCEHLDDNAEVYLDGLRHLAADVHATVEGCLQAGVTDIRVLDGHGRNQHCGLLRGGLHPAAKLMMLDAGSPQRIQGLDAEVDAILMVGQHAMPGTLHAFLDHTQSPKEICRYLVNGEEFGEMSQFALYAGAYGIPLVHVSGDEALCAEAARIFPGTASTATKRGLGWSRCELYPPEEVRARITTDVAAALRRSPLPSPMKRRGPFEIAIEFGWSALADDLASYPGVRRPHARIVSWTITDPRDIYSWPSPEWHPSL